MFEQVYKGKKLTGTQLARAEEKRSALYQRMQVFMQENDFLILPVNQVPPFDVKQHYIKEINDAQMETYIDWMKSCYFITVTGHPAISVPFGFTPRDCRSGYKLLDDIRMISVFYN